MHSIQGMIVPLITPLKGAGDVDVAALKRLCEIQIESGFKTFSFLARPASLAVWARSNAVSWAVGDTAMERLRELMNEAYPEWEVPPA